MGRLQGKVAMVTGAARGIGRAVMQRYAAEGAIVYAADIIQDELEHEVSLLQSQGLSVHACRQILPLKRTYHSLRTAL